MTLDVGVYRAERRSDVGKGLDVRVTRRASARAAQCRAGAVSVVVTNSPSTDRFFGELFATAVARRGVRGVVVGCSLRNAAQVRGIGCPEWSWAASAHSSVKATARAQNDTSAQGQR